jgi:hypothetical protein
LLLQGGGLWDCDLGKLYVSIFPYFTGLDFDNMCFMDDWARATLLWDTPSIEFIKAYLSVVCSEFEAPDDLKWWRKQKSLLLKFENRELSATGEFMASESAAVLTAADWIYREATDIGYAAAVGAYSEASGFKEALDPTCDGLKAKGLSISSGVIDEVVSGLLEMPLWRSILE